MFDPTGLGPIDGFTVPVPTSTPRGLALVRANQTVFGGYVENARWQDFAPETPDSFPTKGYLPSPGYLNPPPVLQLYSDGYTYTNFSPDPLTGTD